MVWKALPEPRPFYGLPGLQRTDSPVLLVEGEKTADAAKTLFYVMLYSPGAVEPMCRLAEYLTQI